jgi:hypothetical protein
MKLKFASIAAFTLPLLACSSLYAENTLFQDKYLSYESETTLDNIVFLASKYFSSDLLFDGYDKDEAALDQLLFWQYLDQKVSFHESSLDDIGCLSINGYTSDKKPIVVNVKYIQASGEWLMDVIRVKYVNTKERFVSEAECPEKIVW